ncbi:hypothetical protein [Mammaliicoccus lentus]|uniref:hypothetical protein n=1 Tax=Mammaliicoccus lentus TaxID=42858 RepID=UPI001B32C8F5|nr:hypothetical protein [Mammaliicoccus lentus]
MNWLWLCLLMISVYPFVHVIVYHPLKLAMGEMVHVKRRATLATIIVIIACLFIFFGMAYFFRFNTWKVSLYNTALDMIYIIAPYLSIVIMICAIVVIVEKIINIRERYAFIHIIGCILVVILHVAMWLQLYDIWQHLKEMIYRV